MKNLFSYFSTKTYVVGTQKNRLNETVLLAPKTYVKTEEYENIYNFTLKLCLSKPVIQYKVKVGMCVQRRFKSVC